MILIIPFQFFISNLLLIPVLGLQLDREPSYGSEDYGNDPGYSGVYTRNWSPIHSSDIDTRNHMPVFGSKISIGDSGSRDQENSQYKYYSDINTWGQQRSQVYHDMNMRNQLSLLGGKQYSTDINTSEWVPVNRKRSENHASKPLSKKL